MKNVIITGATGMVGGIVLQACLDSDEIGKVTSIARRKTGASHPKLVEVVHDDFKDYSKIAHHFDNQDIAQFCIGVYTGAVDREKFREITVDYTKAFADQLKTASPDATFCFLSGQGADQTEMSRVMFAKDKGIAENYLMTKAFNALYIFRPAYIYPVVKRKEPNLSYRLSRSLYPMMKRLFPSFVIESVKLGQAMFKAGLSGAPKTVLENEDIKLI